MVECLRKSVGPDPFFGETVIPTHVKDLTRGPWMHQLCLQYWAGSFCRPAHDGVSARAVGEVHGCGRSQPVYLPHRGHHQPWKPHQGDSREWHEGGETMLQTKDTCEILVLIGDMQHCWGDCTVYVFTLTLCESCRWVWPSSLLLLLKSSRLGLTTSTWLWSWLLNLALEARTSWRTWWPRYGQTAGRGSTNRKCTQQQHVQDRKDDNS